MDTELKVFSDRPVDHNSFAETRARRPKIGLVTLNWNNYPDTARLLSSFASIRYPERVIYVADNGSVDGSMDRLEREFSNPEIVFIRNGENLGFSAGCNRAIERALRDQCAYVLLINNDCIVRDAEFIERAIQFAEENPTCGIVGGKILFWPDSDTIWSTGGYINRWGAETHIGHREVDQGQYDQVAERTFISGALMLIKRPVIERIGFLPEEYFFGKEEWEYSTRAIKAGFKLLYCPSFTIYHEASHSHVWTDPTYVYNGTLSKALYKKRNHGWLFFTIWLCSYWLYLALLFPFRYRLRKNLYVHGIEPSVLRFAMMSAVRDCLHTNAITRGILEEFRNSHVSSGRP